MEIHEQLGEKLDSFPRIQLGVYPTPLEHLPRLSLALGRGIYIKRDDGLGPGMGGNKTRKLEYLLADALRQKARKVVTFGGLQSNHARITAAAARQVGLEPHLFFFERRPARLEGNLLVNRMLGAGMHFVPLGSGGPAALTLEQTIRLVRLVARLRVGPHYFIPVGGHSLLGCLGYVRAALEIDEQARSLDIENAWLVVAAGTGGTLAGLLAGLRLLDSPIRLLGIDVGRLWKAFPGSIARSAGELCTRLGQPQAITPDQVPLLEGTYVGQQYGAETPECMAALSRLARLEGILLDPIYTGKAFAGLLDLLAQGKLGRHEPVIFLHTGGLPGLFAFCDQILQRC
jgi:D-cysteine desulfhydrase family pyridoxal phosphate-dependent enzyme